MSGKDLQDGHIIQERIKNLTSHLERELDLMKSAHCQDLEKLKNVCISELHTVLERFEQKWIDFNQVQLERIFELEEQITYIKELNQSQRLMMEETLLYIKELENQLSHHSPKNSGKTT